MPTEEEASIISQLNCAIAEAVSDIEQFDVDDDLDTVIMSKRRRDVGNSNPNELNALALRYGNACNGVLRASACVYQQVILEQECRSDF